MIDFSQLDLFYEEPTNPGTPPSDRPSLRPPPPEHLCYHGGEKGVGRIFYRWADADSPYAGRMVHALPRCLKPAYGPPPEEST